VTKSTWYIDMKLPLALQFSSASLGAVTMYRTTAELLLQTVQEFTTSIRLFYQGVFLLGAFHVALSLEPMLSPEKEDRVEYSKPGDDSGMKIDIQYVFISTTVDSIAQYYSAVYPLHIRASQRQPCMM
jgi:hypothetical protein